MYIAFCTSKENKDDFPDERYLWICAPIEDSDRSAFAQSDQNFQWAFWIVKDAKFFHADNEDSDQTAWMCRLI